VPQLPAIQWGMIAGIRDHGGGRRVVFTDDPMSIPANTTPGESYHVAPGWHRMTDIWGHKEWIVWQGEKQVLDADKSREPCGSCRSCCITLFVADEGDGFTKPSHKPCHNLCNEGCAVYKDRPRTCKAFECVWAKSQKGNRAMAAELRPDRCGVILTDHEDGPVRVHQSRAYPKSDAMQAFIVERTNEGEQFQDVTHYIGEARG